MLTQGDPPHQKHSPPTTSRSQAIGGMCPLSQVIQLETRLTFGPPPKARVVRANVRVDHVRGAKCQRAAWNVQASTAARARVKTKGEHVSVGGSSLCDVSNFCSGGRNTHVSPSRSPHHEPLVHTSHCPQGCGYVITHTSIRTAGAGCAHNRACGDAMTVLTGWLPLD